MNQSQSARPNQAQVWQNKAQTNKLVFLKDNQLKLNLVKFFFNSSRSIKWIWTCTSTDEQKVKQIVLHFAFDSSLPNDQTTERPVAQT